MRFKLVTFLLVSGICRAQRFEAGGLVGYGVYRNAQVNSSFGQATAGFGDGAVAGALFGEDLYRYISGEVRYLYQNGHPFLSLGGTTANLRGDSHSLSYDLLIHFRDRESAFRPYVAGGLGAKYYRTTQAVPPGQPLTQIGSLADRSQWQIQYDFGVGMKYRLQRHVFLRADFRDYITPFPKHLFRPADGGRVSGIFHQFTPTAGLSFGF
jgi:hypothetical protein